MVTNRRILLMDEDDNVGVLLETANAGDTCLYRNDPIEILEGIDFGHKVSLSDIHIDRPVIKYGLEIGFAEKEIKKGQWVHVHNMGCKRGQ